MSLVLSYSVDLANRPDRHSFMLSSSFSGSLGMLGWGLSLTGTMYSDDIMSSMYSGSLTLSLSASRNVYFSAGLSMNGSFTEAPSVFGRASATIRFNPARATISISENDLSAEVSVSNNRHSFSAESSVLPRNIAVFDDYSFHADYSYSGDFINFGAGFNANNSFDRLSGNLSISTSSVFADGLMAFGSTIPSNYILISQSKALKGNEISVGSVGSSMSTPIDTIFGVGLYTGLSLNRTTSLSVYSINSESFGSAAAFDVTIPATGRGGYVLRLAAENKYSLSGIVELPDGSVWANGSSPVYMVEETDSGIMLLPSEYYVFADNSGRFIVTDFEEGRYAFDVSYGDEWLLYEFYVFENEEHHTDIQMLENPHVDKTEVLSDVYSGHYVFDNGEYLTGNEFWAMLYPEMEEAV